eukprot:gb/GECG01015404.1/.p1 GENE.gb/GECG01015404.1/~~gb/GECG01015404.1/.p1  ORF type:complete len:1101 (+),score=150.66 gb/GECG01015404.1/:1-3303(+)
MSRKEYSDLQMTSVNGSTDYQKQPLLDEGTNDPEVGGGSEEGHGKSKGEWEAEQHRKDMEMISHTDHATGLTHDEVERRRQQYGYNELAEEEVNLFLKFLSYFWGPMPCMIWVAIIVEMIRSSIEASKGEDSGEGWADFGVLLLLQLINGCVGFYEEHNAGNAIAALKQQLAPKCFAFRNGEWHSISARELVPGDYIQVKLGDVIPADAILLGKNFDSLEVDQAALTGESLPVTTYHGEKVLMGSSVKRGELDAIVCATGENTFFGKAAGMIASVDSVGHFQKILLKITTFLLIISCILCIIILIVLLVRSNGKDVFTNIGIVIVLLVASIPIAMQVVCTSTMAVGARRLADKKVIVARLSAIEELAAMTVLCSDKTGTLTKNQLECRQPFLVSDMDEKEMLFYSALAAKRIKGNQDAIDYCICEKVAANSGGSEPRFDAFEELEFHPFNPTDKRTEATLLSPKVQDPSGKRTQHIFKVTKGAPQVVLKLCLEDPNSSYSEENRKELWNRVTASIQDLADRGFRALGVAIKYSEGEIDTENLENNKFGGWEFQGLLSLFDPPRDDTKATIEEATNSGVEVKMITGDQTAIAKETCRELGMGTNILNSQLLHDDKVNEEMLSDYIMDSNGFAEVMPEDKFEIVNAVRKKGHTVGMTGDGVNDAPALKRADIGIAVEGATDAARAAADIVLTEPGLSVIIDAMQRSRKIFQRMRNYCIYRIACTIELLLFFFFAIIFVEPSNSSFFGSHDGSNTTVQSCKHDGRMDVNNSYNSSFYLPVIALVVITILNDGTIITIAHDKVIPEKRPQHWDLWEVMIISSVQGAIACLGSLILVVVCFQASWHQACQGNADSGIAYMFGDEGQCKEKHNCPNGQNTLKYVDFGSVQTLVYLKISLSDFLTVFSARTRGFFWERRPGYALLTAFIFATTVSTILSLWWPEVFRQAIDFPGGENGDQVDGESALKTMKRLADVPKSFGSRGHSVGFIWIYSFLNFAAQDIAKVGAYWLLSKIVHKEGDDRVEEVKRRAKVGTALGDSDRAARQIPGPAREASILREASKYYMKEDEKNQLMNRLTTLEKEVSRLRKLVGEDGNGGGAASKPSSK